MHPRCRVVLIVFIGLLVAGSIGSTDGWWSRERHDPSWATTASAAPASSPPTLDDGHPDQLRLSNEFYEAVFSKVNGGLLDLIDRHAGRSLQVRSRNTCLWSVRLENSLHENTHEPLHFDGNCSEYNRVPSPAGGRFFSWSWDQGTRLLTFRYALQQGGQPHATLQIRGSSDSYLDLELSYRNVFGREGGGIIRQIYVPGDLRFPDSVEAAYLPAYMPGVRIGPGFFTSHLRPCRHPELRYPGDSAFADFAAFQSNGGKLAIYTVNPAGNIQPANHTFHDDVPDSTSLPETCDPDAFPPGGLDGWYYRHAFQQWWMGGAEYRTPTVRLRLADDVHHAANAYRLENRIHQDYPSFDTKAAAATVDATAFRRAPLVKADLREYGNGFWLQAEDRERWNRALDAMPRPSILHLVSLSPGGHDEFFPEILPPDPNLGSRADLASLIALAVSKGHLVMPYTNPTWWDDAAPSGVAQQPLLRRLPQGTTLEQIAVRQIPHGVPPFRCEDSPTTQSWCGYSSAFGHAGYAVTPTAPFVVSTIEGQFDLWAAMKDRNLIIFEDQVGARPWFFDFDDQDASGDPMRFSDGWVAHTARHLGDGWGLSTEHGYDRLARTELSFHGDITEKAGAASGDWGTTGWAAYPLAPRMFGDKVVFHRHDLSAGPMTDEPPPPDSGCHDQFPGVDRALQIRPHIRHAVAFGTSFSHYGRTCNGEFQAGQLLALTGALQQTVGARYAGAQLLEFTDGRIQGGSRMTRSVWNTVTVDANWQDDATYTIEDHIVAPGGFYARNADHSVIAGLFTKLNGQNLAGTPHYVFIERSGERTLVRKPIGGDTNLTVKLPAPPPNTQIRVTALSRQGSVLETITLPPSATVAFNYRMKINDTDVERYVFEVVTIMPCSPRPPVRVQTQVTGDGRLQATITAGSGSLTAVRFGDPRALANARVDISGGQSGVTGSTVHTPPPGATQVSFFVTRRNAGLPVTVHFTVVDGCGDWRTFVGGGTGAGF